RYPQQLRHDVARWDVLLSPNPFSTPILRSAFGYDGTILETGYPRNDVLVSPGHAAVRADVRTRLGIAEGVRAILYAPTWRDSGGFDLALDLELAERRLGRSSRLLLRAHPNLAPDLPGGGTGWLP